jgi:hypothetical protein
MCHNQGKRVLPKDASGTKACNGHLACRLFTYSSTNHSKAHQHHVPVRSKRPHAYRPYASAKRHTLPQSYSCVKDIILGAGVRRDARLSRPERTRLML